MPVCESRMSRTFDEPLSQATHHRAAGQGRAAGCNGVARRASCAHRHVIIAGQPDQPLDVVGHEREGQFIARQRHRPHHLAAQLLQPGPRVLAARSRSADDGAVARVQPLSMRLARPRTSRDTVAQLPGPQQFPVSLAVVALVGQHTLVRVARVEHLRQGLPIVDVGRRHRDLADQVVARIDVAMQLVPIEALAMLLRPARLAVGVAKLLVGLTFGRLAVVQSFAILAVRLHNQCLHNARVHDLTAARDVSVLLQLQAQRIEDRPGAEPVLCQPPLEAPQRACIGDVQFADQSTEELEAHAIDDPTFTVLVAEVVQRLQEQHAHHDFGRIGRTSTLAAVVTGHASSAFWATPLKSTNPSMAARLAMPPSMASRQHQTNRSVLASRRKADAWCTA